LLINGGAATAVLALLAKEKIPPTLLTYVPWSLALYAAGVTISAGMLFCVMMMADNWNYYWYAISYTNDDETADESEENARWWHKGVYGAFIVSIGCFLLASLVVAIALLGASVPAAQAQSYQPVDAGDLFGGYVAEGRIETSGHIGAKGGVVAFKTSRISAQAPTTVETTALPRALMERIARECAWDGLTVGGCSATLRERCCPGTRATAADDVVIDAPTR
jgi:hypothetical protein